jgi:hypothetical protein
VLQKRIILRKKMNMSWIISREGNDVLIKYPTSLIKQRTWLQSSTSIDSKMKGMQWHSANACSYWRLKREGSNYSDSKQILPTVKHTLAIIWHLTRSPRSGEVGIISCSTTSSQPCRPWHGRSHISFVPVFIRRWWIAKVMITPRLKKQMNLLRRSRNYCSREKMWHTRKWNKNK